EALAHGCEVFVPVFPSFFGMSPLSGFEEFGRKVYAPEELAAALEAHLMEGGRTSVEEKRAFAGGYWCLDPALPRWKRVFGEETVGVSGVTGKG
ncbi:MAG: hypothetical protein V3V62_06735, partial [bacterium]